MVDYDEMDPRTFNTMQLRKDINLIMMELAFLNPKNMAGLWKILQLLSNLVCNVFYEHAVYF
jgi:hypothetical protein